MNAIVSANEDTTACDPNPMAFCADEACPNRNGKCLNGSASIAMAVPT